MDSAFHHCRSTTSSVDFNAPEEISACIESGPASWSRFVHRKGAFQRCTTDFSQRELLIVDNTMERTENDERNELTMRQERAARLHAICA